MAITTITNSMVSVNAIQGTLIADNAITAVHIASNAVASIQIAENNVTARELAANTITVAQLADDCVEADKIADGVITTNHLNKAMISSQTEVTPVAGDFVLLGDTSDSNNLKKAPLTLLLNSNVDLSTKLNLSGGTMTGNLGIGGDPGAKLDVNSGTTNTMAHFHTTDDNGFIELKDDDTTAYIGVQNDYLYIGGAPSTSTQNLVINDGSGKVGIGTTSPQRLLQVGSYGTGNGEIAIGSATDGWGSILFGDNATGTALYQGYLQYNHSSGAMLFATAAAERMRIDSSGRVGINRTPAISNSKLEVGGADNVPLINVEASGNTGGMGIGSAGLQFFHGTTKRMQIISDGEIVQGNSMADTYAPLVNGITADAIVLSRHSTSGSLGMWRTNTMEFKVYHNGIGYIMTWGSNGVISGDFNDTSDVNLKENISSISDGTTIIKALRPVKFDWKASGKGNNQHGFIAQEVETVLPDAVEGNNYVENETGLPEDEPAGNGKTMNSNAVLAHAVKAIQELEARIKVLEG